MASTTQQVHSGRPTTSDNRAEQMYALALGMTKPSARLGILFQLSEQDSWVGNRAALDVINILAGEMRFLEAEAACKRLRSRLKAPEQSQLRAELAILRAGFAIDGQVRAIDGQLKSGAISRIDPQVAVDLREAEKVARMIFDDDMLGQVAQYMSVLLFATDPTESLAQAELATLFAETSSVATEQPKRTHKPERDLATSGVSNQ